MICNAKNTAPKIARISPKPNCHRSFRLNNPNPISARKTQNHNLVETTVFRIKIKSIGTIRTLNAVRNADWVAEVYFIDAVCRVNPANIVNPSHNPGNQADLLALFNRE